jgi:hypothetical protein
MGNRLSGVPPVNGITGKIEFESMFEAKITAFDLIDSGRVNAFLQQEKRRARNHHRDVVRTVIVPLR